jgi:hypothetical protein
VLKISKPIENVDIVAAILTSSLIEKLEPKITPSKHVLIDQAMIDYCAKLFDDVKDALEK